MPDNNPAANPAPQAAPPPTPSQAPPAAPAPQPAQPTGTQAAAPDGTQSAPPPAPPQDGTGTGTIAAAPAEPPAAPEEPVDPRYARYQQLYKTGQWDDDQTQRQPQQPQSYDDIRQMLDQRLPPPNAQQQEQQVDPIDRMTQLLANGDVRGFMQAQAEYLKDQVKPAEPAKPPVDPEQFTSQVLEAVRMERQINSIVDQARQNHQHLMPLSGMIEQRAQQLWDQAQQQGRIKSDADVPVAYKAALDTAIAEADDLYKRIRGTGQQTAPNVTRTDVVVASPGVNVAERDAAPIGQQPSPDDVSTTSWLEQRRKVQFAKKRDAIPFSRSAA